MDQLMPGLTHAPSVHPVLVHFPIALFPVALLLWVSGMVRERDDLLRAGRWVLWLGVIAAGVALASGWVAADKLGHDAPGHDLVHVHRNWMIAATALALVAAVCAQWLAAGSVGRAVAAAVLAATVGVLVMGADRGAELVFRYGMGVANEAPPEGGHSHDDGEADHDHGETDHDHAGGDAHDHGTGGEEHEHAAGEDHAHAAGDAHRHDEAAADDAAGKTTAPAHDDDGHSH